MRLFITILALCAIALALPSPDMQYENSVDTSTAAFSKCVPGQLYCFGQIMSEFGIKYQDILHQYCQDQFTVDALSCHACTKQPFPLPNCWAGPGAWNSVFECMGDENYKFKFRCDDFCEKGKCTKKPAGSTSA